MFVRIRRSNIRAVERANKHGQRLRAGILRPSTVASSTVAAQRLDEKRYALAVPIQTDSSSRAALNCPPSQMDPLALAMQELDTERMADS